MKVDPSVTPGGALPLPKARTRPISSNPDVRSEPIDKPRPAIARKPRVAEKRVLAPDVAAGIDRAGRIARIGTADMRREMTELLADIEALIPDPRTARVAAWVVRGEVRKLEVLDGYISGYIRG